MEWYFIQLCNTNLLFLVFFGSFIKWGWWGANFVGNFPYGTMKLIWKSSPNDGFMDGAEITKWITSHGMYKYKLNLIYKYDSMKLWIWSWQNRASGWTKWYKWKIQCKFDEIFWKKFGLLLSFHSSFVCAFHFITMIRTGFKFFYSEKKTKRFGPDFDRILREV